MGASPVSRVTGAVAVALGPVKVFLRSERPSAVLVRWLAPVVVLGPVVLGLVLHLMKAAVPSTLGLVLVLGVVLWFAGRALDRVDAARARTEDRLRGSEEQLRRLLLDAPIGMGILDLNRRFVLVNLSLSELTGYPVDRLEGSPIATITHPEDVAAAQAGLDLLVRDGDGGVFRAELRVQRPDGSQVWVSLAAVLMRDTNGAPLQFLGQFLDVSDRKRSEVELRHLADHDHLTGLFNRRRFDEELTREVVRAKRQGAPAAVLVMDLDRLKEVNDSLGHLAGDRLIVRVATVCRQRLRRTDITARFGGDEFTVLLPGTDRDQAERVAEDLLDAVRREAPLSLGDELRPVTASIGIAELDDRADTAEQLVRRADTALYLAKDLGRNRVHTLGHDGDDHPRSGPRSRWADRIERALDRGELVLHAQPIVAVRGGVRAWHELLLRMVDNGQLILPGRFIHVAERSDLAQRLDDWVLGQAIGLLARHQQFRPHMRLGVNLSARSLADPDLALRLGADLDRAGVDGRGLCIEITETAALTNIQQVAKLAAQLRDLGCQIALDDFGSGYASFHYLKYLDIDYIKIDGEFIRHFGRSTTNQVLVKSIIQVARGLGARAIAEFVEDRLTLALLRRYGIHYVQGFHLARPQPLRDIDVTRPTAAIV